VTKAQRPAGWTGSVFVIVMENHSFTDIMGSGDAPTINALARDGAVAAGYHDSYVHPSEPNYLWMVAGENFGILDDDDPGPSNTIASTSHIADQIEHAGLTWRAYEEDMGNPCGVVSHGNYAAKHDPFVYFSDLNGWNGSSFSLTERCNTHVVDFSQLATDLADGQVPDYVFITPNLQHDMHDGSVGQGDAWLASVLPRIQESSAYRRGGVIFLLWDEGSNESDNPPFIVASPNARPGMVSQMPYDTSSFLLTTERILGLDALPCSRQPSSVRPMDDLFTIPLGK
jgi:phospholipase C